MKGVLYLAIFGVILPVYIKAVSVATPQNATDVSGFRRTEPFSFALAVAGAMKTVASIWKSFQKDTTIKIHINNLLNAVLESPQWYSLHGHATMLPPPVINQGGEIAEIQFSKTESGGQGTEGILAYAIDIDKFIYLLIQWRVPQFGVTESISFDCKVVAAPVNRTYLETEIKANEGKLKKSKAQSEYVTAKAANMTYSVHSAMGTQNLVTLNVVVTSG